MLLYVSLLKAIVMYGLVNKAIKDLVVTRHGEEKWNEICASAGFEEGDFVGMNAYPDSLTYDLVKHASRILTADANDILEAFGEYWITYTAEEGYGYLMELSGDTFPEFLGNLDMLHLRISGIMPHLEPPQFTTRNVLDQSLELEYRSKRPGLTPMLLGLIKGLGKRFGIECTVKQIEFMEENGDCHVFLISW
jgi:hypothetical protein